MIIKKVNTPIVCDMGGCSKKAIFFVEKKVGQSNYFSLKLCQDCARELSVELSKALKKEKGVEKK